ncbi:chloroplastic NIFS-like cysteine desulfurase [Prunus dulcis]|uniref:Chloroplastic NIFS-like cysteine desulfurase n=1 Tax=Prunus dulcis TaxID=3755 RepID=A0A5H2XLG9_PRUDU|nr:chloroplastic NIFS-like cysteine desulfurase [Prunus dulcis]
MVSSSTRISILQLASAHVFTEHMGGAREESECRVVSQDKAWNGQLAPNARKWLYTEASATWLLESQFNMLLVMDIRLARMEEVKPLLERIKEADCVIEGLDKVINILDSVA